jgi:hypothetical protein
MIYSVYFVKRSGGRGRALDSGRKLDQVHRHMETEEMPVFKHFVMPRNGSRNGSHVERFEFYEGNAIVKGVHPRFNSIVSVSVPINPKRGQRHEQKVVVAAQFYHASTSSPVGNTGYREEQRKIEWGGSICNLSP